MIALKGKIFGKVQGVFFRKYTRNKANELNVKGFVRNESDGTVYFEAEGEEENIEKFKKWCRQGPPGARVVKVEAEEAELRNYKDFQIKY